MTEVVDQGAIPNLRNANSNKNLHGVDSSNHSARNRSL